MKRIVLVIPFVCLQLQYAASRMQAAERIRTISEESFALVSPQISPIARPHVAVAPDIPPDADVISRSTDSYPTRINPLPPLNIPTASPETPPRSPRVLLQSTPPGSRNNSPERSVNFSESPTRDVWWRAFKFGVLGPYLIRNVAPDMKKLEVYTSTSRNIQARTNIQNEIIAPIRRHNRHVFLSNTIFVVLIAAFGIGAHMKSVSPHIFYPIAIIGTVIVTAIHANKYIEGVKRIERAKYQHNRINDSKHIEASESFSKLTLQNESLSELFLFEDLEEVHSPS